MNKKLLTVGGIFAVTIVLLAAVGVIGFVGWRYLQKRSAFSEYAFRNQELELPGNIKYAEKNAKLTDENTKVMTIGIWGTIYIGKASISSFSKTKDKEISEKISGWKTSSAQDNELIYVAVSKNEEYKKAVEVLRILAENKIEKIGLVTGKKDNGDDVPGFLQVQLSNKAEQSSILPLPPIDSVNSQTEIPLPIPNSRNSRTETMTRPNPLSLYISVTKEKQLSLNLEKVGTTDNTASLTDKLSEIFKERETNGVFKSGTNEVEKTVYIKASFSNKYEDVVKMIDAAKGAGASPIILQLQDLSEF